MRLPSRTDDPVWRGQITAALLALTLTLGMANGGSLALLGIGGGLLLYGLTLITQKRILQPDRRALGFAASLLALALLASLTAFAPERSSAMNWRLFTIVLPLTLLLTPPPSPVVWPRWFRHVPWAVLGVELVLIVELMTRGGLFLSSPHPINSRLIYYDRGLSYAAVLIWPLCAMLAGERRYRMALGLIAGLAAAIWLSPSRGACLALAIGAGFALLAWRMPRLSRVAGLGLLFVVAGLPFAAPWVFEQHPEWLDHLPISWRHRFEIWDYMQAWNQQPWLGHGLDAAGVIPVAAPHHDAYIFATGPAAHPHHAALQLWLEL